MSSGKPPDLDPNDLVESLEVELDAEDQSLKHARRRASVYDAVAGRVNLRGFHPSAPFASRYRDTLSSGARVFRPEEVLMRSQNIPKQSAENEIYFAHESLPADGTLPSSELLEAIHAYAADYYEYATEDHGQDDYHSMDETALIAMGILVEEMAQEALGDTGDLVLVEGQELSDEEEPSGAESDGVPQLAGRALRRKRANTAANCATVSTQENLKGVRKKLKRRKVTRAASTDDMDTEVDEAQ
ncbi:hypothetical protein NUU61_005258 [Penicillium alfredii]|uniref:Uncharacterized protein n=1 Tax=Penicillium alfredii TaxID=1506179 RepID=A0A9W9F9H9_9EURO|nr:uncharacterized protein NUU61_005258 [Penicillium alfredii]KAJ5095902.1 hypothetical protein NUU61_005258 [Penicillium alfredii]